MAYSGTTNDGSVTAAKNPTVLAPYAWDIEKDFRPLMGSNPTEIHLRSVKSPLGRETEFKFAYANIANIYNNSRIDKAVQDQHKAGVKAVVSTKKVYTFTDATTGDSYDKPVTATLTVTCGKDPAMDVTLLTDLLRTLLCGCYNYAPTGSSNTADCPTRVFDMLRGVLLPENLG